MSAFPTTDIQPGQQWQHVKRGTSYEVLACAELQTVTGDLPDGAALVVYRGDDGKLWAREEGEFTDGRFRLTSTTPTLGDMVLPGVTLVKREADKECGCPEEEWETPWGYLSMHLNAGKPSDAALDNDEAGYWETNIAASSVNDARAAIFGWAALVALSAAPATPIPTSVNGAGERCSASPDHADILETIENADDAWQAKGYTSALAEVRDMANVGRALMEALPEGYSYMSCPSEIVSDLQNEIADLSPALDNTTVEIKRLRARVADLETSVIAFGAPWAIDYGVGMGLPEGYLHPAHYDILAGAGARMDDFTRATLTAETEKAR